VSASDERDELTLPADVVELLEESAEDLYENAPTGYFSSLLDGTIVKANGTLLRWTGYERDDVVGAKRIHDLLAPGARIYYETHYAPLLVMQGSVREIAVEIVRADGSRLPALMTSSLVRDDDGHPRLVRTTVFDASERRGYERELLRARADAEARARAALALEHSTEGVLLLDGDGRIELVNPRAEEILEVAAADATGQTAADAIAGWTELVEHVPVVRRGERPQAQVVPRERASGDQWLALTAVAAGERVVYTLRDVTSEQRLDRLRSDLVTVVSHELRTPLTGAFGAAKTLTARYAELSDGDRRALLDMIVEQTARLTRIVDQILLTSRLDNENVVAADDTFDAEIVFDTVVELLAGPDRRRVVVDVERGVRIHGDVDWLRQVLTNLLDNALKYSDGEVRIGLATRELHARLTVADDGPGIPAAEREHVFDKFYRLDPSQHGGVGGTGLGLYIARELVERMGGRIGLLPRERGTTFSVDMPLA
jgi:PAS domain S-box-containing protein